MRIKKLMDFPASFKQQFTLQAELFYLLGSLCFTFFKGLCKVCEQILFVFNAN